MFVKLIWWKFKKIYGKWQREHNDELQENQRRIDLVENAKKTGDWEKVDEELQDMPAIFQFYVRAWKNVSQLQNQESSCQKASCLYCQKAQRDIEETEKAREKRKQS